MCYELESLAISVGEKQLLIANCMCFRENPLLMNQTEPNLTIAWQSKHKFSHRVSLRKSGTCLLRCKHNHFKWFTQLRCVWKQSLNSNSQTVVWFVECLWPTLKQACWWRNHQRKLRSRFWWFTESCNSHYVSHFAALVIVARAKISVVKSRFYSFFTFLYIVSKNAHMHLLKHIYELKKILKWCLFFSFDYFVMQKTPEASQTQQKIKRKKRFFFPPNDCSLGGRYQ